MNEQANNESLNIPTNESLNYSELSISQAEQEQTSPSISPRLLKMIKKELSFKQQSQEQEKGFKFNYSAKQKAINEIESEKILRELNIVNLSNSDDK